MPAQWLDFRALKARVPIRDVLAHYRFLDKLREKKPGKLVGPCPIHGGVNGHSFNVDTEKNVFHCFSQCGGGNVLDLVTKIEHCSIREAGEKLADWFGLTFEKGSPTNGNTAEISQELGSAAAAAHTSRRSDAGDVVNPPLERPLQNLGSDHEFIKTRGITLDTAKHFGIGYCTRGMMRGRVAIPIANERDELVAYAGRAVDEELAREKGKYRLPTNFMKSHVLYNLNRAKERAAEKGLIVVEGFFDAMKVHQAGFPNVVALMGSTLSEHQVELLIEHTHCLALMFDGDDAGAACLRDFYGKLRRQMYLKEIHLDAGEQPDSLAEDRVRELLA